MTENEPTNDRGSQSPSHRRLLIDANGRRWEVHEVTSSYDRRTRGSLIYDCGDVVRRVRTYPADWYERSDAALLELSNHP